MLQNALNDNRKPLSFKVIGPNNEVLTEGVIHVVANLSSSRKAHMSRLINRLQIQHPQWERITTKYEAQ